MRDSPPPAAAGPPKRTRRSTPASRAASRSNAWKHGRRAVVVSEAEGRLGQLRRIDPRLPEIIEACVAAMGGDLEAYQRLSAAAFAEATILRQAAADEIFRRGAVIEEKVYDRDGREVGIRLKANPMVDHVHRLSEQLGFTAPQMMLTAKSRGESVRDAAAVRLLERAAMLRAANKSLAPAPPASEGGEPGGDSED